MTVGGLGITSEGELFLLGIQQVTALDGNGLKLADDAGNLGLTVLDGGAVKVNAVLYINETANARMTIGLTIQQGIHDNEILSFKSTDIAHGITDGSWGTETDTYGYIRKSHATRGGVSIAGYSEVDYAFHNLAAITTCNTTRGLTGYGAILFDVYKKSGSALGAVDDATNLMSVRDGTSNRWSVDENGATWQSGSLWIWATANSKMNVGITVDQGGYDNEIFSAQSTDVAHGITSETDTSTYFSLRKIGGATGGAYLQGFAETVYATVLRGNATGTDDTKGSSGLGPILLDGAVKSGTTRVALAAGKNLVVVRNYSTGVWIVDSSGHTWQNGVMTADSAILGSMKSGATQVAAGAAAGELWYTVSHATLPDYVVMMGV